MASAQRTRNFRRGAGDYRPSRSVPDEADLLQLLVVEIFHAFAEIDAAMAAIEAAGIVIVLKAPDDETIAAKRLQQPAGFAEEHTAEADTLIFRAKIEFVDFAFLRQVAERGYVDDYEGIRISKSGKRFPIADVTVWQLIDVDGTIRGQAARLP